MPLAKPETFETRFTRAPASLAFSDSKDENSPVILQDKPQLDFH